MSHNLSHKIEELAKAGYDAEPRGVLALEIWRAGQQLGTARLSEVGTLNWVFELKPAGKRRYRPNALWAQITGLLAGSTQWPTDNHEAAQRLDFVWAAKRLEELSVGSDRS